MQLMQRRALTGLAFAAVMLPASAVLAAGAKNQGYLVDTQSNVVTSSTTGLCVRTSEWTPARAIAQCDPDLVKKPAPAPRVAPPPPAPKKAAPKKAAPKKKKVRLAPVTRKLSVQNFDFDKATLRADQKKEIDRFLNLVNKGTKRDPRPTRVSAVVVSGHTDRLGSEKYNQKLSEQRAVTVKDYLVSKGVDQKLIFWEGKGESTPVPVTKFCDNKMSRKQLIECLSPNRRVEIEVVGGQTPKPKKAKKKASSPARKR
jgi:OOP family OmpA-OmpF porin